MLRRGECCEVGEVRQEQLAMVVAVDVHSGWHR